MGVRIRSKNKAPNNAERKKMLTREYALPIEDFEHRYPWLVKRVISYDEYDEYRVFVELDNGKTLLYDNFPKEYYEVKRFNNIFELTDDEYRKGFSDLLKEQMLKNGIGQNELAEKVGVSKNMIFRYLHHLAIPNTIAFCKIVSVLDCNAEDLIPEDYIKVF